MLRALWPSMLSLDVPSVSPILSRYFRKGSASLLGLFELVNEEYASGDGEENDGDPSEDRLVPRTEDLPLYTVAEFNDKVRSGTGLRSVVRNIILFVALLVPADSPSAR